jgi:hypothetical protein
VKNILIRLTLAVGVIVFMTSAAYSELLVYEPFDYPVGSLINNGGAFGLDGVWEDWGLAEADVVQGSLVHPEYDYIFDAVGNQTKIIDGDVGVALSNTFEDDGRDYWVSFLYNRIDSDCRAEIKIIFPEGEEIPLVAIEINGGYPAIYPQEGYPYIVVSGVTDPSAVTWFVIKAETSGSHRTPEMVYMWVNPDPRVEPLIADAGGSVEYDIPKGDVTDVIILRGSGDPAAYYIDEFKIGTTFKDVGIIPKCENASNPVPENGTIYVDVDLEALGWDAPTCVDEPTYNVYLSTDTELGSPKAEGITETSYTITESPLEYDTVYYWRVDVMEPNEGDIGYNVYEGRVWHFTTFAKNPTITAQPVSTTVEAGSDARFSIEAINADNYEWYIADTPDGTGTAIENSDSPDLDITAVNLDDEGYYYCIAKNNDEGTLNTTNSERARLLTERLMAHWQFEDNLEDENNPLNNGTPVGTIGYDTGIVEETRAVAIVEPNSLITTANDLGKLTEITVSIWISPNALVEEQEQVLLAANGTWEPGTVYIYIVEDEIYGQVIENQEEETSIVTGPAAITEGVWNHCVYVYDTSTQWSGFYINGELVEENDDENIASVAPILPPLSIGAISLLEGLFYNGLIDDLRIYDYRLSDLEIASLYIDIVEEAEICIGNPDYDLSGNCLVDLADLELVASQWLECNIVPTCLP